MGRASRWLRGLLGGKRPATAAGDAKPANEKRRWGFVRSFREKETAKGGQQQQQRAAVAPPVVYEERRKGSPAVAVVDEEAQSKRAIAVAAATAAVAEAAVAAAQAAAAVVRLTSSGRSAVGFGGAKREEWAAVKIQAAFRGYLARRALRALKGLVKLQALVRGNIVRKQAAETLRCMQALVRVQARTRACRALRSERSKHPKAAVSSSHPGPPTPEKYEPATRASVPRSDRSGSYKRNSSKTASADSGSSDRAQSSGWNWLDRWMEERYWDSREAAATKAGGAAAAMDDEKNAKILEIDTGKPQQLNPKRRSSNRPQSSCSTVTSDRNSRSFATVADSPSKDSTAAAQQSIPSPSSVDMQQPMSPLTFPIVVEAGDYTDSPQFYSASSRPGSSRRGPFTPAKSECARSLFSGYSDCPNYMANTESSKAKFRSQSAPRQRSEFFEKSGSLRRVSAGAANGFGREAAAVGSAQRSSAMQVKFVNKAYPGSGRLDRLGMPIRY